MASFTWKVASVLAGLQQAATTKLLTKCGSQVMEDRCINKTTVRSQKMLGLVLDQFT